MGNGKNGNGKHKPLLGAPENTAVIETVATEVKELANQAAAEIEQRTGSTVETPPIDLASAPALGQEAYHALMDAANQQVEYLRSSGLSAIKVADDFRTHCLRMVEDICSPVVTSAMEFQQLCNKTADDVLKEASMQAERAVAFTTRLKDMSQAVSDTANGETNVPSVTS